MRKALSRAFDIFDTTSSTRTRNSLVRTLITRVLIDDFGEKWWEKSISQKIRRFAEFRRNEEEKTKWHGARGADLLSCTELKHLGQIVGQHFDLFEPTVRSQAWATFILGSIERCRNVIMHSGTLDLPDIERIGISMRDWNKQFGLSAIPGRRNPAERPTATPRGTDQ